MTEVFIRFESLKREIEKYTRDTLWLARQHPGEYTFDRMLQILGKQERSGRISVYNTKDMSTQVSNIIENFDIRCLAQLLKFCKEYKILLPSWLYKGYTIELTDDGWCIFKT